MSGFYHLTEIMGFRGTDLIISKIVVNDTVLKLTSRFNYFGNDISHHSDRDIYESLR